MVLLPALFGKARTDAILQALVSLVQAIPVLWLLDSAMVSVVFLWAWPPLLG